MAVYCNKCGSANPDGSDVCTRCGAHFTQAPSDGLDLPDWLKQAVSEPSVAAPVHARSYHPEAEGRAESTARPSIPTGDLAASIPSWLKDSTHTEPLAQESLLTDPTDTRGFITEDDLPAWIRQIAIEEDAKQAEREKAAQAAAEAAAAHPESPAETTATPRRRLLPGEIDAAHTTSSQWLARGDRPAADAQPFAAARTAPAEQPVAEAPVAVVEPHEPVSRPSKEGRKLAIPSRAELTQRQILIGAIVLVALVAIVILVLL
jgi:hypothetical protein